LPWQEDEERPVEIISIDHAKAASPGMNVEQAAQQQGIDPSKIVYTTPLKVRKAKVAPWDRKPFYAWYQDLPQKEKEAYILKRAARGGGRKRRRYGGSMSRKRNFKRRSVRGRGEYTFAPSLFSYGNRYGDGSGGASSAGDVVVGLGEYKVQANSLMANIDMGTDPPRVMNTKRGEATIIAHRDYVGELYSGGIISPSTTSQFNLLEFDLNIGNQQLFPWAWQLGALFQEWEPRGILVELKTEASDYAQSITLGSMFMGVNYTSMNGIKPNNKQELENLEYSVSGKPSKSIILPVECAPQNNAVSHFYIALNGNYNGADPRFCDLGKLYIGTQGIPAASVPVAEIWVTYEVALYKPRIYNLTATASAINFIHYRLLACTTTQPLGGEFATVVASSGDWSEGVDATTLVFPASTVTLYYLVLWTITSSGAGSTTPVIITTVPTLVLSGDVVSGGSNNFFPASTRMVQSVGDHVVRYMQSTVVVVGPNSGQSCMLQFGDFGPALGGASGMNGDLWVSSTGTPEA